MREGFLVTREEDLGSEEGDGLHGEEDPDSEAGVRLHGEQGPDEERPDAEDPYAEDPYAERPDEGLDEMDIYPIRHGLYQERTIVTNGTR